MLASNEQCRKQPAFRNIPGGVVDMGIGGLLGVCGLVTIGNRAACEISPKPNASDTLQQVPIAVKLDI